MNTYGKFAQDTLAGLIQRRENSWIVGLPADARLWKTMKTAAEDYLIGDMNA